MKTLGLLYLEIFAYRLGLSNPNVFMFRGMEEDSNDLYTKDGTVDVCGRPAIKSSTGLWKASSFILVNQALVSITYYGVYNNLVRYLTNVFHEGNASAANNVNIWTGTSSITSLIGAFLSDSYFGRYWTTTIFLLIYLLSMILLTLSAALSSLRPSGCRSGGFECKKGSTKQSGFLYFSLYLGALAAGAYQPCNSSLGADQFDEENPSERPKKTIYFNWFYLSMTLGSLIASTIVLYIQESVSWGWGFGLCTVAMALSILVFLSGTPFYRNHRPGGNPLVRVLQVFVASFRKTKVKPPTQGGLLYEVDDDKAIIQGSRKILQTENFRFLDKAATRSESDETRDGRMNPWRLCTVTQVEEVKCIIRMLPIFLSSIVYSIVYSQMATLFLEQGGTMDTHLRKFKIPPGSLSVFENFSIIFWTPTYEYVLVPCIRRFTKHEKGLTDLQRIGTGLVIIMLAMVVAALVEIRRLQVAKEHGLLDSTTALPMSVFWLVPQYFLIGASEVFTFIGLLEFFYDQSPDAVRALGSSFQLTALACGNYLSSLVVTIVTRVTGRGNHTSWISDNLNRSHLDYFYWMLAIITGVDLVFFLFCACSYKYIRTVGPSEAHATAEA